MAMTKKEREAHEKLIAELRLLAALRWTSEVKPDVPPPNDGLTKGFLYNEYDPRVVPACSSGVYHAFGRDDKTDSQGSRALYSSKLLALRALRHAVEVESAKRIAKVDEMIEKELKKA
jgi:hypothetical protein